MKRIKLILILLVVGTIFKVTTFARVPTIYMNDNVVNLQNVLSFPYVEKDSNGDMKDIYVPLKVVCESMGIQVGWDQTKKVPTIKKDDNYFEFEQFKMDNGVALVTLESIENLLDVDIEFRDNRIFIKGDFNYIPQEVRFKSQDIVKYGNTFKGRLNDPNDYRKVIVASRKDLPINIGNMIVYDVYKNDELTFPMIYANKKSEIYINMKFEKGTTLSVKMKYPQRGSYAGNIYFTCEDGLNRGRNTIKYVTKNGDAIAQGEDENGIITALYPVTSLTDQFLVNEQAIGNDYQKFTLDEVEYVVFKGKDVLLAIPAHEVLNR